MDGNFSNCDLELAARDDDCNILVDDAGWNVFWSLDRSTYQLVADQERYQGALRVMRLGV